MSIVESLLTTNPVSPPRTFAFGVRMRGFTLIELVVAMAIIGILAAIAIPQYTQYVLRSHRADAQSFIGQVATREQQYMLDRRAFAPDVTTLQFPVPTSVAPYYNVTIAAANGPPPTFTVTATPSGGQTNDACGVLSINQAGTKSAAAPNCW